LPRAADPAHPRRWFGTGFTADEVRLLLRFPRDDARGQAVRRCILRPQDWLPPHPHATLCPLRYHEQLPRIIFWYMCGNTLADIAPRIKGRLQTGMDVPYCLERALDTACRRIAVRLNAAPREYGAR
jgi:hypothetical protein